MLFAVQFLSPIVHISQSNAYIIIMKMLDGNSNECLYLNWERNRRKRSDKCDMKYIINVTIKITYHPTIREIKRNKRYWMSIWCHFWNVHVMLSLLLLLLYFFFSFCSYLTQCRSMQDEIVFVSHSPKIQKFCNFALWPQITGHSTITTVSGAVP